MELVVVVGDREERVHVAAGDREVEVRVGECSYRVDVARRGPVLSLLIEGRQIELVVVPIGRGQYRFSGLGSTAELEVRDLLTHLAASSRGGAGSRGTKQVCAYMPGRVVSLMVAEGDRVEPGQGILVLEAMKMENEIQTELAGEVQHLFVSPGQAVEAGDPLFEIA